MKREIVKLSNIEKFREQIGKERADKNKKRAEEIIRNIEFQRTKK